MLAVVDELGERGREGSDGWEMRLKEFCLGCG